MGNITYYQEIIDGSTGEIKYSVKQYSARRDINNYFFLFADCIPAFLKAVKYTELKVFLELGCWADLGGNTVRLNKTIRDKIAEAIGSKSTVVNNAISKLVKSGYLTRLSSGYYELSPHVFWKGKSNDRLSLLKQREKQLLQSCANDQLENNSQSNSDQERPVN